MLLCRAHTSCVCPALANHHFKGSRQKCQRFALHPTRKKGPRAAEGVCAPPPSACPILCCMVEGDPNITICHHAICLIKSSIQLTPRPGSDTCGCLLAPAAQVYPTGQAAHATGPNGWLINILPCIRSRSTAAAGPAAQLPSNLHGWRAQLVRSKQLLRHASGTGCHLDTHEYPVC